MKKLSKFIKRNIHWIIVGSVGLLCTALIIFGHWSENGKFRTLDGSDAKISDATKKFIEDANDAMYRIMNQDMPTDQEAIDSNAEPNGQGFYTNIYEIIERRLPDGNNDNGKGWQCSKYTAYLATGKREYSSSHPDYGPVNGKDVAAWLVNNYGFKYIDQPVEGAIGSGGFNTTYGHTAMYLYPTGTNTAMVNDANYTPLTVSTHNMNISGWVWVVPGNYNPAPEPTPTPAPAPAPEPSNEITYTYSKGDYFSKVLVELGLDENNLWGANGTVRFYTQQLIDQNVLDYRGNVIIGKPFTLIRR